MKKILFLVLIISLGSCATKEQVVYFQDSNDFSSVGIDSIYHHPKIQVNDILKIDLTALEPETLMPFMFEKNISATGMNRQIELLKLEGYLVDKNGDINYPGLGKVNVKGKSTQEVQELLEKRLSKFIKDISVKVRLVNFKFTVMGEVKAPGTYTLSEETNKCIMEAESLKKQLDELANSNWDVERLFVDKQDRQAGC